MSLRIRLLAAVASASIMTVGAQAQAAIVVSADAAPAAFEIEAQARNGRTGFEAILKTPGIDPTMNPSGAPVWQFGTNYNFAVGYDSTTGTATFGIDYNKDNDFLDSQEFVSSTNAGLIGFGFNYVNLFIQGNALSSVNVSNFTLNGASFGPYNVGNGFLSTLFENTAGPFANVNATGTFSFSANGATDERPRLWVQLGGQTAVVPEPGAWALMIGGFGLAGAALRRRRALAVA